jgi:hypothetical protein
MTTSTHDAITARLHEVRADCTVVDYNMLGLFVSGAASLLGATAVLYAAPVVGLPRIDAVTLAGSMFSGEFLPGLITGAVLWSGVGMLFAVLYVGLWMNGYTRPGLRGGLLLGLIHGNIVMLLFPLFLAAHPLTQGLTATIGAGISLVLAHVVFGAMMGLIYREYAEDVSAPC